IGVLVVIQSLGLFAGVALRGRVRLIAADAFDVTAVNAADLNLKAAIEAAQYASRRNPLTGCAGHQQGLHRWIISNKRATTIHCGPHSSSPTNHRAISSGVSP